MPATPAPREGEPPPLLAYKRDYWRAAVVAAVLAALNFHEASGRLFSFSLSLSPSPPLPSRRAGREGEEPERAKLN
eukprot:6442804-Pyramimonas_sp.AAC.1